MSVGSLVLARVYSLPQRLCGATRQRDIALPMDDGVTLMTDVYSPRAPGPHPTILMRLPYGRNGFGTVAECYAERGFHVVLQACRGTEKSGGDFDPLVNERADGLATLEWIKAQPWYDGRLGLSGPSYLGYAQWAICDALPEVAAMATKVTSAEFQSVVFPSGAFHLGLWLSWLQVIEGLRGNPLQDERDDVLRRRGKAHGQGSDDAAADGGGCSGGGARGVVLAALVRGRHRQRCLLGGARSPASAECQDAAQYPSQVFWSLCFCHPGILYRGNWKLQPEGTTVT